MIVSTLFYTLALTMLVGMLIFPRGRESSQVLGSMVMWGSVYYSGIRHTYVIYLLLAVLSVGAFYAWWQGPPQSQRTLIIVEALVTLFGIVLVLKAPKDCPYTSVDCRMGHMAWAALLFVINQTTGFEMIFERFGRLGLRLKWWLLPPKQERLTLEEYRLRGEVDTREGLRTLRNAHVDGTDTPRYLERLRRLNDPKRFIEFALSGEHVTEEERDDHERRMDYVSMLQKNYADVDEEDLEDYDPGAYDDPAPSRGATPRAAPSKAGRGWTPRSAPAKPANGGGRFGGGLRRSPSPPPVERAAPRSAPKSAAAVWKKADLEKLSNKELLTAMVACGLPRKPVTATTRDFVMSKMVGKPKN